MKAKRTPGPWNFNPDHMIIYRADNDVEPTIAYVEMDNTGPEQFIADGHLIAAAPEMLAALLMCVEPTEPGEDCPLPSEIYNVVCAAIAKAKNER